MRYVKIERNNVTEVHMVADAEDNGDKAHGEKFLSDLWGGVFKQHDTAGPGWTVKGDTFTPPPAPTVDEQIAALREQITALEATR